MQQVRSMQIVFADAREILVVTAETLSGSQTTLKL